MRDRPVGDVVERHLEYARCANGEIHMVTYSLAGHGLQPKTFEDRFAVYPSHSLGHATFPLDAYRIASRLCRRLPFDVIYTQDPFGTGLVGVLLCRRFNIPLIIGNHSSFIDNARWIAERPLYFAFLNRLAKRLLPHADAWRVINVAERDIYVHDLGIPRERIFIINTPVNVQNFASPPDPRACSALRGRLGIPDGAPVLLWVGRPVRFKRIPVLLAAFKRVLEQRADAWLVLVGRRSAQQEDLAYVQRTLGLDKQVVWLEDWVPHADLPSYYHMATVYAHTSHYEGFGKVVVEAAAAGLPVVATDTAGAREVVQAGETGYLVPVDDDVAFAERVVYLFNNSEHARYLGGNGRQYVLDRFDREKNIDAIVELWRRVAQSRPCA